MNPQFTIKRDDGAAGLDGFFHVVRNQDGITVCRGLECYCIEFCVKVGGIGSWKDGE